MKNGKQVTEDLTLEVADAPNNYGDALNIVVQAADLLCEEIRESGTHVGWKQLAHALDSLAAELK